MLVILFVVALALFFWFLPDLEKHHDCQQREQEKHCIMQQAHKVKLASAKQYLNKPDGSISVHSLRNLFKSIKEQ